MPEQIKSYERLVQSPEAMATLNAKSEREIADYRAFMHVGTVHAKNVNNVHALDIMIEVTEFLQNALQERKKVID